MKYKISINKRDFEVETRENNTTVNGKPADFNLVRTSENEFHLISGNKGYTIEIAEFNSETKEFKLKVNNRTVNATLQNELDQLLSGMGMTAGAGKVSKELKAPMPGLVVDILAKPDQAVSKGDPVIILEAMKMENVLKATGDAVVKSIEVKKGHAVEKNQVLIRFQ